MEMYSMKTRPTIQCTKSDKNGKYSYQQSRDVMDHNGGPPSTREREDTSASTGEAHTSIHMPHSVGNTITSHARSAHIFIVMSVVRSARSTEGIRRMLME